MASPTSTGRRRWRAPKPRATSCVLSPSSATNTSPMAANRDCTGSVGSSVSADRERGRARPRPPDSVCSPVVEGLAHPEGPGDRGMRPSVSIARRGTTPLRRRATERPARTGRNVACIPMRDRPIGMFDSGFGGLTVARAVIDLLPAERLVYVGDTGRYPYGPRPLDEVRRFAHQIAWSLVKHHDVKAVVVACNTAGGALDELEAELPVPVIGVIDPGVRALAAATRNGRVGVIGTVGTIASGAYQRAVRMLRAPVELTCAACPGFVEFVERGETASEQ